MAVDAHLLFDQPAQQDGHLLFGATGGPPPVAGDDVRATPAGQFPALGGHVGVAQPERHQARPAGSFPSIAGHIGVAGIEVLRAQPSGGFPPLAGHVGASYRSGVARPLVRAAASDAQPAQPLRQPLAGSFTRAQASGQRSASRAQQARPMPLPAWAGAWASTQRAGAGAAGRMQDAQGLQWGGQYRWQQAQALRLQRSSRAQQAHSARQQWRWAFETALLLHALLAGRAQQALPLALAHAGGARLALLLHSPPWAGRWQLAMPAPPALRHPDDGSAQPQPQGCYTPSAQLVFCRPSGGAELLFECGAGACSNGPSPETVVVPVRRVYIVHNSITLTRIEGGVELHPLTFEASLDVDSWTWSWSATLHHSMGHYLGRQADGEAPVVEAVINGQALRLRIESRGLDERFNPSRWRISGRGINAILSAPHAPTMAFSFRDQLSAQQIAQQVLTLNGVPIGWDVDWQLPDWQVPGGSWVYGGSYMDAINELARAVGGYVQPHATLPQLRLLPRYPTRPWQWDSVTPDYELPAGMAELRATEFVERPHYNRIWVGGEAAGVSGFITRGGSAGDQVAPQALHPLITDSQAQLARGIAELSNTGAQEHVTLSLQVLPQTGLILPGKFVRHTFPAGANRQVFGIVRRTSIHYDAPKLRQSITLEAHPNV
ncbi:hypothetical protein [Vandammella animalimorsus]|uniref:hypothetical protein n=1 Tax=Vandammella animalimorsus TaxID=2029117 RepID=UPI0011C3DA47|nr:hypothetical protein [Vandammella animalimorsus]